MPSVLSNPITDESAPRSYDEIILTARAMRAEHLSRMFGNLRRALFSGRGRTAQAHGLTPHAR